MGHEAYEWPARQGRRTDNICHHLQLFLPWLILLALALYYHLHSIHWNDKPDCTESWFPTIQVLSPLLIRLIKL